MRQQAGANSVSPGSAWPGKADHRSVVWPLAAPSRHASLAIEVWAVISGLQVGSRSVPFRRQRGEGKATKNKEAR